MCVLLLIHWQTKEGVMLMKRLEKECGRGFSYNSDIAVLENYYQHQYDLIKKGDTDLVTFELVMLGNALDFIDFVKRYLGIKLDAKEKSVEMYDEVMDALSRGIINRNLFDKTNNIAKKAGAYLGFLIIANIGGEWIDTNEGEAVIVDGREVYVCDFAANRLMSGSELNAADYYKKVRTLRKNEQPIDSVM